MARPAACGSWASALGAELAVAAGVGLDHPAFDGDRVLWQESRPTEKGRSVVVQCAGDDVPCDLTEAPFNARTLVHDPAVMIFDEPTLGLDVMTARTIVKFVRDCKTRGKTVIYSTHVMSEVEKLCDTVGIIHDGKLLAEGTLPELRTRYAEQDMEEIFVKVVGMEEAK